MQGKWIWEAETQEVKKESALTKEELLKHFVEEGSLVLQNLDNLGNFLMGFGMIVLGYMLSVNLQPHLESFFEGTEEKFTFSCFALFAWTLSILCLLGFIYLFIFHLLAGRAVFAHEGKKDVVGERLLIKKMSFAQFQQKAPDYATFLKTHYLPEDRICGEQLWYATFRYTRYMAYRKLMVMNKMRELLGAALLSGVVFKILDIALQAL